LTTPQDRAEALFKRKERKEAQFVEGQQAWAEYEEQGRATREKDGAAYRAKKPM
jgi:hypothetical protein